MNNEMAKIWTFLFSVTLFLACFFNMTWIIGSVILLVLGFVKFM